MPSEKAARYASVPQHEPYLSSERYENPKEDFKTICRKLEALVDPDRGLEAVDLGCANGELLYLLKKLLWSITITLKRLLKIVPKGKLRILKIL